MRQRASQQVRRSLYDTRFEKLHAPLPSGSFRHDGMIVAPCSMKTLAAIRYGSAEGLIPRAADVTLKERRRLVLMARETPLNDIHLENMLALSRMGVVIAPPMPAFYTQPRTIDDLIDHTVGRVLDLFGLEMPRLQRWAGIGAIAEQPAPFDITPIIKRSES